MVNYGPQRLLRICPANKAYSKKRRKQKTGWG
jgi:hypothetical protein